MKNIIAPCLIVTVTTLLALTSQSSAQTFLSPVSPIIGTAVITTATPTASYPPPGGNPILPTATKTPQPVVTIQSAGFGFRGWTQLHSQGNHATNSGNIWAWLW